MKVALVGTHSTGKTTLAEAIGHHTSFVCARTDSVRSVVEDYRLRLDEIDSTQAWQVQDAYLDQFELTLDRKGDIVCDGSPVTTVPYATRLLGASAVRTERFKGLVSRSDTLTSQIDLHLYSPPELPLEDDGFRPLSEVFRSEVDKEIVDALEGLPFYIICGNAARRLAVARKILDGTTSEFDRFIAFEGLPGSGKTTQIRMLQELLQERGEDYHICQRFTDEGRRKKIQQLYADPMANRDELLQYHLDSFLEQYERNEVDKRIARGQIVITDRQKFTVLALQRALGQPIGQLYERLSELPMPGRVIYIDVEPELAVGRRKQSDEVNPIKLDVEFQKRVSTAYRWLSAHHIEVEIVNGNRTPAMVHYDVRKMLHTDTGFCAAAERVEEIMNAYAVTGTLPWGARETIADLAYQVGGLSKTMMQLEGYVHTEGNNSQQLRSDIALDIGDVLSLILYLSRQLNIDPDEAFRSNLRDDMLKILRRSSLDGLD